MKLVLVKILWKMKFERGLGIIEIIKLYVFIILVLSEFICVRIVERLF